MVAIAIFTLLVAAVYSTWVVILKSSQVGQEAAAQAQRERIAIRTIEDSLTCIQSFQASMQYYDFRVTNGDQPALSFVARVPDVFPRNGRFDSHLRRLTFSVEPVSVIGKRPGAAAKSDSHGHGSGRTSHAARAGAQREGFRRGMLGHERAGLGVPNGIPPIPCRRWCASRSRSAATSSIRGTPRRHWPSCAKSPCPPALCPVSRRPARLSAAAVGLSMWVVAERLAAVPAVIIPVADQSGSGSHSTGSAYGGFGGGFGNGGGSKSPQ